MEDIRAVFVLIHETNKGWNTVLGVFADWESLRRTKRCHLELFPEAKLTTLNMKIGHYIFEEHFNETYSGNLQEQERQAVAMETQSSKR